MAAREQRRNRSATTEQLRHDIDSGRTRDKVPFVDPAAVPLGTDEEAAGISPPSAAVDTARRTETDRRATAQSPRQLKSRLWPGAMLLVVLLLLLLGAVARW